MKDLASAMFRISLLVYALILLLGDLLLNPQFLLIIASVTALLMVSLKDEFVEMICEPSLKLLNLLWCVATIIILAREYGPTFSSTRNRLDLVAGVYHFPFFIYWLLLYSVWKWSAIIVSLCLIISLLYKKYSIAGWAILLSLIAIGTLLRFDGSIAQEFRAYFESI